MDFTRNKDNSGTLKLDGDLTIERAAEMLEVCREAMDACDRIVVEFGEVDSVDLTCLQLLCSAHRTALSQCKKFSFADKRPDFLSEIAGEAGFLRKCSCKLNTLGNDCLWLGGGTNE